jgi:hypothetical protein
MHPVIAEEFFDAYFLKSINPSHFLLALCLPVWYSYSVGLYADNEFVFISTALQAFVTQAFPVARTPV